MPISFEQPQPMSPAISSAYGQAAVMQQNNPLFLQQQQMRQQQMLAQQEMQQRAAEHSAAVQQQAAELAQRGELARQEMGLRQQALDAEQNVSAKDVFHAQAAMAQQQQAADLHAYYSQQEMTQHEAILLQRKRQALAEVMNNPNLDAETRNNMALQIKTGIDPLDAKAKAMEVKRTAQLIQTAKTQEQLNAAKLQMASKAAAMTAAERTQPLYDDGLEEQLDAELVQRQQAGKVGDLTPQERQAYIRREAQARGGFRGYRVIQPDGSVDIKEFKPPAGSGSGSAGAGGKGVEFNPTAGQLKMAQAEADAAVPPVKDDVTGKSERTDENAKYLFRVLSRMRDEHAQQQKPARQPWAGVLPDKPAAAAGQQPQPAGGQPAGATPKDARVVAEQLQQDLNRRQMSEPLRAAVNQTLDKWKRRLAEAGGYENLSKEEKEQFEHDNEFLDQVAKQRPVAPPPPPAPAPAAQPPAERPGFFRGVADEAAAQFRAVPAAVRSLSPF